jgi:hypothetical protein
MVLSEKDNFCNHRYLKLRLLLFQCIEAILLRFSVVIKYYHNYLCSKSNYWNCYPCCSQAHVNHRPNIQNASFAFDTYYLSKASSRGRNQLLQQQKMLISNVTAVASLHN